MNNLISNLPAVPNLDQLGSTPASGAMTAKETLVRC